MELQVLQPDLQSLWDLQDLVLQEDLLNQAFLVFLFLPFLLYHLKNMVQQKQKIPKVL